MLCKTIILSNSQNLTSNAPKGILTLSKENGVTRGKIRLYNLSALPQSVKVGLYINEKVYIETLNYKQQSYTFDLPNNIDIGQSIYCALIDTANNKQVLLEGGNFNGFYFSDSPFDAIIEAKDEQLEQTIDRALQKVEEENGCDCNSCDNCANCEYKKYFYSNYAPNNTAPTPPKSESKPIEPKEDCRQVFNPSIPSKMSEEMLCEHIQSNIIDNLNNEVMKDFERCCNSFENDLNKFEKNELNCYYDVNELSKQGGNNEKMDTNLKVEKNQQLDFLNDIIYQLDELLTQNPEDKLLNSIIPNSRFVKVENESPYVLGVIYEDKMLKYIAYGVPATYNELPPADLGQHYQWLPLNPRDVMSDGYFMIFQDALNGNLVEINFEE